MGRDVYYLFIIQQHWGSVISFICKCISSRLILNFDHIYSSQRIRAGTRNSEVNIYIHLQLSQYVGHILKLGVHCGYEWARLYGILCAESNSEEAASSLRTYLAQYAHILPTTVHWAKICLVFSASRGLFAKFDWCTN